MQKLCARWRSHSLSALLLLAASASAEPASLFSSAEPNREILSVRISGPLTAIAKDRAADPEERDGTLTLVTSGETFAVTLRPRGKSRRNSCAFPPLWLKFDKKAIKGSPLAGHHRRKLVTHCSRLESARVNGSKVWLEMLAYQVLNLLTDASFRVAPLSIQYQDSGKPGKVYQRPGFLLEHKKELASRLNASLKDLPAVPLDKLDPQYSALTALFNLFIGNPDFSARMGPANDHCCHNTVPVTLGTGLVRSIPYDFDNTGWVNPSYATTPDNLPIRRVTQRVYRGYCRHNPAVAAGIERLLANRAKIEALVASQPGIDDAERARVTKFIARFYERYTSHKGQERHVTRRCLG